MITIFNKNGQNILTVPFTDGCVRKRVLMAENHVLLTFSHPEYIDFKKGSYITWENERFEVMSNAYPERSTTANGWNYSLQFDAADGFMRLYRVFYLEGGIQEAVFALTSDLLSHGNVIAKCMNHFMGGNKWRVKAIPEYLSTVTKLVSYKAETCFDATNMIAEAFECECWIEVNGDFYDICFGKMEYGTEEVFRENEVVRSIPRKSGDESNYGTRFFCFGSTRNLTSDYGQVPQGGVTNHVSEIRLRLPDGIPYVDAWEDMDDEDVVQQVVFFEDEYPKNTETVTGVETVQRPIEGSSEMFTAYVMVVNDTPFTPDHLIEGETLGCVFQTGQMAGREFQLQIKESNFDKRFEIIAQFEGSDGSQITIPNEFIKPEIGDTFILTGVKLPQERIREAEQDLLEVSRAWARKNSSDTGVYDCPTNVPYCARNNKNYDLGQKVRLMDIRFGTAGRSSRIQGYEKKLANVFDATYTIADNSAYSRFSSIEAEIKASQYSERVGVSSGAGIYLIRSKYDTTQPTEYNAYSALATNSQIITRALSRLHSDVALGFLQFLKGATFGEFASGVSGFGAKVDELGNGEFTSLVIRRFMEAPEFRFNRVVVNIGDDCSGPSGGLIESVDTANQIVTLKLEKGDIGTIEEGDICMGIYHSEIEADNSPDSYDDSKNNRRYAGFYTCYFRVTEVIGKDHKKFKYQLRPVSDSYPRQFHPAEAMTFWGFGSFTNPERRESVYRTKKYTRWLKEVDTWEFSKHNIAAQIGDMSNLSIFGYNMTGYSAYLNNIYITGVINQMSQDGETVSFQPFYKGDWVNAKKPVAYYDYVSYDGSLWLCVNESGSSATPSKDSEDWVVYLEKGADGNPGDYTTYIFKSSPTKPDRPTGNDLIPEGWVDGPSGYDTWWMSKSLVSGKTGYPVEWSDPIKVSGKDGSDTVFQYARNNSYQTSPTSGWTETPPFIEPGQYLWMRSGIIIPPATEPAGWSEPIRITGEQGNQGEQGLYPAGRWQSNSVPYRKDSVVKLERRQFRALRETSKPPVGLLKSGDNYLLSGGYYIMRGPVEQFLNSEDWEIFLDGPIDGKDGQDGSDGKDGADGKDGKDGNNGLQGMIYRTSEWVAGTRYRNDINETFEPRFIDVVTIISGNGWKAYQCKPGNHLSTTDNKPSGDTETTYWKPFNMMDNPIYTSLVMAPNSIIRFMQGQQLLIQDNSGNVVAGISGQRGAGDNWTVGWFGPNGPDNAPIRFDAKGNGYYRGYIDATGGIFRGYIQTPYKLVEESDAIRVGNEYKVNDDLYLMFSGQSFVILPSDLKYNGRTVKIYNAQFPPYTKIDVSTYVRTENGLSFGGSFGMGAYPSAGVDGPTTVYITGNVVEFEGVPERYSSNGQTLTRLRWMILNYRKQ